MDYFEKGWIVGKPLQRGTPYPHQETSGIRNIAREEEAKSVPSLQTERFLLMT
jgi:hypothetical protein